jgi:hypothetical protein
MRKALRVVLSVTMLAVLGISQIPAPASCQMAYGNFLAKGCRMPCCKTEVPLPARCPLLKAQTSNDTIAGHSAVLQNVLQVLYTLETARVSEPHKLSYWIQNLSERFTQLFPKTPQTSRAPPQDVVLQAA